MGIKRVYTLDDGSKVTAQQVSEEASVSLTTARNRLCRTNEREKVYAKALVKEKGRWIKTYLLSDGTEWTVDKIAKHTGATRSCIGARLYKSRDAEFVLKPQCTVKDEAQRKLSKTIKGRMCFGDREHWLLLAANT